MRFTKFRNVFVLLVLIQLLPARAEPPAVTPPAEARFQQDLSWSPDGRMIAFSEIDTSGEFDADKWSVYTVSLDDPEPKLVAERSTGVSWSPDGKRLAFAMRTERSVEICVAGLSGGERRCLTENDISDKAPSWSPDGKSIAFHSNRTGSMKIFVMDADGNDVWQVTSGEGDDEYPMWSPDGARLVFYRGLGDGADQVWTVGASVGGESRVTNDANNNIYPSFRPDGRIEFGSKPPDGVSRLVHCAPDGSDRVEVTGIETFFARTSPDGKRIAFISGRWPKSAIYVTDVELRSVKKIAK